MTFYQKYVKLCGEKGKTPSAVALDVGLSKAAVNGWKTGRSKPTDLTKQRLSEYFNIPIEYFEDDIEKAPADEGERLTPKMQELIDILSDSDSDMLEDVLSYTMYKVAMKNKNQP